MTTLNIRVIERLVGVLLFLWGLVLLFTISRGLFIIYYPLIQSGELNGQTFSLSRFLTNFHLNFLLPLISIFSGILLFFEKRIGWISALIALLLDGLSHWIPYDGSRETLIKMDIPLLLLVIFLSLIFLVLFRVLLLKEFRLKYHPQSRTYWFIAIITIVLLLDKALIDLFD